MLGASGSVIRGSSE